MPAPSTGSAGGGVPSSGLGGFGAPRAGLGGLSPDSGLSGLRSTEGLPTVRAPLGGQVSPASTAPVAPRVPAAGGANLAPAFESGLSSGAAAGRAPIIAQPGMTPVPQYASPPLAPFATQQPMAAAAPSGIGGTAESNGSVISPVPPGHADAPQPPAGGGLQRGPPFVPPAASGGVMAPYSPPASGGITASGGSATPPGPSVPTSTPVGAAS